MINHERRPLGRHDIAFADKAVLRTSAERLRLSDGCLIISMEPNEVTQGGELRPGNNREMELLRATVIALREKLEESRRQEEGQNQAAIAAQAAEVGQLKATVLTLRDALEAAHRANEEAVQDTIQRVSAEMEQMRQIAQALRDKLDAERMDHNRLVQTAIQQLEAENVELRNTVKVLRDALECRSNRTKQK